MIDLEDFEGVTAYSQAVSDNRMEVATSLRTLGKIASLAASTQLSESRRGYSAVSSLH